MRFSLLLVILVFACKSKSEDSNTSSVALKQFTELVRNNEKALFVHAKGFLGNISNVIEDLPFTSRFKYFSNNINSFRLKGVSKQKKLIVAAGQERFLKMIVYPVRCIKLGGTAIESTFKVLKTKPVQ